MKMLVGFIFGLTISAAFAEPLGLVDITKSIVATFNAGVGPDSRMAPIKVDARWLCDLLDGKTK
jgi:hypothetical protein